MAGVEVEGRELSEGELEDGEVLSSEGEEEEEGEEGEEGEVEKEEDTTGDGTNCEGSKENSPPAIGTKRPAQDAPTDVPDAKAAKLEQQQSAQAPGAGSDAEEGEIFSDDEEAAYFPQRIKSRDMTAGAVAPSDASGSDAAEEKRTRFSRGRGTSGSPERDPSRQTSRRRRSRERERDSEPKSLASLFFEDRDGTPSEQSDDGREARGRRKGEGFSRSSSPGPASSRSSGRERDRGDRSSSSSRDHRERQGGEGRSHYRTKDSHYRRGGRGEKERDRNDSNVDSSDEELATSWSQRRAGGGKGYHQSSYHQRGSSGGRRGYQSKYGQKHDRFGGGDSRVSGGRAGRMTAQELRIQAENVKKRRERGLSLLQTPKMKPSDNLDEFNYPAPPSWYLEAVEKWEKEKESEGVGQEESQPLPPPPPLPPQTTVTVGNTTAMECPLPPPLFPPPLTQFPQQQLQQQQPPLQVLAATNASLLGDPPQMLQPLVPGVQVPPTGLQPLPTQIPSLFPQPPVVPLPPQPPPAVHVPHMGLGVVLPPPNPALGGTVAQTQLQGGPISGGSFTAGAGGGKEGGQLMVGGPQLAVVGLGEEEGGGKAVLSTVRVSSLALDISTKLGEGGARGEEEDEEEGGMKIALETPTPQPSATADAKTFSFVRTDSASEPERGGEDIADKDAPAAMKENEVESEKETETKALETTSASGEEREGKRAEEEKMEVEVPTSEGSLAGNGAEAQPGVAAETDEDPTKIGATTAPSPVSTASGGPPSETVAAANLGTSWEEEVAAETELKTYSPPPPLALLQAPPTSSVAATSHGVGSGRRERGRESEVEEEGDSDYDKYLDQLDQEEDGEEAPRSALVGSISASLLQNNPLDEEFPAINPAAAGNRKTESLKSLVVGESGVNDRGSSKGRSLKLERRRQKESDWWRKRNSSKKTLSAKSPAPKPPCKFYLNGFCKQGEECSFSHDVPRPKKKERCKFYLQDSCTKGDECRYYHGEFPCKFFHTGSGCKNGDSCKFSHSQLTKETSELLAQVLDPARTPTKWVDPVAMGFPPPNGAAGGLRPTHGTDPQVNIRHFPTAPSDPHLTSPLLISIPKQVLEASLLVSVPRQRLGPPFGTVPIPPGPHSAPANQPPPVAPHSLPRHIPAPQSQPIQLPVPQLSNLFPPPVSAAGSSSIRPPQSGPPGNFPGALPPTGPNLPPPPAGWQAPAPVPLFPPLSAAGPQNVPQVPPGLPPRVAPQFPPPPSSERKCLLPTPPSHMRLDPKNILWSEDDRPEYWEAPSTAPFGHQPPPGGPFVPPPPHVPQPQSTNNGPPPTNATRQQQQSVPPDRMDPRQNRMESRPGGGVDPRRGGTPHHLPGEPVGMGGDPRHHVGGAPGGAMVPPIQPYHQPPHPGPVPAPPPGYQGPRPPPQQWPHLSHHQAPPPNLHPPPPHQFPVATHVPVPPILGGGVNSPIPGGRPAAANGPPGGPGGFINPAPFHQPHPPSSNLLHGSPQTSWGPEDSSLSISPPSGPAQREESRLARVDPRTKYSHLRIRSKGSSSSSPSSAGGVPRGREGEGTDRAAGDRTHMPKLLQEPPTLQRPFDPHELFDSATSREVESPFPVAGPFGGTFGSFFTRSSPPQTGTTSNSGGGGGGGLPYGEITMGGVPARETAGEEDGEKVSGGREKTGVETTSMAEPQHNAQEEGDGKAKSAKSAAAVPSYLAELGVENDLTIDSAFSSLKREETEGGTDGGEGGQVMAKKLPSIFGFGSGGL